MLDTIKKQLEQCQFATLSNYDEATKTYHIPKYSKPSYKIGSCYLVKISGAIVKNPTSVMATNWNNGHAPQVDTMKIYISKALGKNVYVDGLGFDLENKTDTSYMWSGWLNVDDLTLIQAL